MSNNWVAYSKINLFDSDVCVGNVTNKHGNQQNKNRLGGQVHISWRLHCRNLLLTHSFKIGNMRMINNFISVLFDENHNRVFNGIYRPDKWVFEDSDHKESGTVFDTNRDKKETNPQIATVIISNDKCQYKEGDKVFTHYLSYDSPQRINKGEVEATIIHYSNIFFKINEDGSYTMSPGTYLGEQVYSEGLKTASGIYLTPFDTVKETLKIKLTHVPEGSEYKVGDVIVSSDDYQYEFNIDGKKLIKITEEWIVGTYLGELKSVA